MCVGKIWYNLNFLFWCVFVEFLLQNKAQRIEDNPLEGHEEYKEKLEKIEERVEFLEDKDKSIKKELQILR